MRMQIVSSQNARDPSWGQTQLSRQRADAPPAQTSRRFTARGHHHFARKRLAYRYRASAPRLIVEPSDPLRGKPSPPFAHDMRVALELPGNRRAGNPIGSHQNYPCSHHQPGFRIPLADDLF